MSKHLNFLGLSVWVPEHSATEWNQRLQPGVLYQPSVIAAYSVLAGWPVGLLLYGMNQFWRGHRQRGQFLMALSGLCWILLLGSSSSAVLGLLPQLFSLFSPLISLYFNLLEKPYFRRAIGEGWRPARWWPPLCFLVPAIFFSQLVR